MAVVTLLTDFGLQDAYVGIVKGVVLKNHPSVTLVDISHDIAPGDIAHAAYLIETAYPFFPLGTVHMVVVDPGVGGPRDAIILKAGGHFFVAPDNGVLTGVLEQGTGPMAFRVEDSGGLNPHISRTFHGRDLFAPVAARLARGSSPELCGAPVDPNTLVRIPLSGPAMVNEQEITGRVIATDRFGNLITDIGLQYLEARFESVFPCPWKIQIEDQMIQGLSETYCSVAQGELLALIGSTNRLEISVNGGSARERVGKGVGTAVRVFRN